MSTPALAIERSRRAATNRRNARHSTGPRSTEVTRLNALQHGVYSREPVLPHESVDDYETLLQEFIDDLKPVGPTELACVAQIAEATWRMHRVNVLEASLFRDMPPDGSPADMLLENPRFRLFAELSKQYGRFDRAFHSARKALTELQRERRKVEAAPPQSTHAPRVASALASFPPRPPSKGDTLEELHL